MKKFIFLAALLLAGLIGAYTGFLVVEKFTGDLTLGASNARTTVSNPWRFTGAVTLAGANTLSGATTFTGTLAATGASTFEELTQGGGITNIATTSATYTLTQAEMLTTSVFEQTAMGDGQSVLSVTLPATSTLTTLLPTAGQFRSWIWDNQAAAATTTTFVAGTGVDLRAYTTNDDVIDGGEISQITCWRKETTDVACVVTEILASD